MRVPTDNKLPWTVWPWIALEWWFLGLIAYHLILEHRVHALGALPYGLVLATLLFMYLLFRRQRKRVEPR